MVSIQARLLITNCENQIQSFLLKYIIIPTRIINIVSITAGYARERDTKTMAPKSCQDSSASSLAALITFSSCSALSPAPLILSCNFLSFSRLSSGVYFGPPSSEALGAGAPPGSFPCSSIAKSLSALLSKSSFPLLSSE